MTDEEVKTPLAGPGALARILSAERLRPMLPFVFCLLGDRPTWRNQSALLAHLGEDDIVLIGRRMLP